MAVSDHMTSTGTARAKIMTVDTSTLTVQVMIKDSGAVTVPIWDDAGNVFRWPKENEIWILRQNQGIWRLDRRVQSSQVTSSTTTAPESVALRNMSPGAMKLDSSEVVDSNGHRVVTTGAVSQQSDNYTFALTDVLSVVESTANAPATFTIPAASAISFPLNQPISVFQYGTGQVTIAAAAGVTVRSNASKVQTAAQYATIYLRQRATNEWVLSGDLA